MKRLIAICIGLAVGIVIAEAVIRIYLCTTARRPAWDDRPRFYYAPFNNLTLQDYKYPERKAENAFRIAVVGDSYTFAPFMQFTDTFPKKLEAMLNLAGRGLRGEVINYGVPAYSTSHEVAIVDKALAQDADLIILQITLNDPEIKPYRPTGIHGNGGDRFGELRPQGWQKFVFRWWKTAELAAKRIHNTSTREAYKDYFTGLFEKKPTWSNFKQSMRRLVKHCRKADKPVVAVVFPLFGLPLDGDYPFHPLHEKIAALLAELGVPSLDLFETYAGIPLERLQVIPVKDRHPNEIAHRMAAEEIYVWLMRGNFLPQELRIPHAYATRLGTRNQPPYNDSTIAGP